MVSSFIELGSYPLSGLYRHIGQCREVRLERKAGQVAYSYFSTFNFIASSANLTISSIFLPNQHFQMNTYEVYQKQLTIQGSFINPRSFEDSIALLASGKVNVEPLISHELGLEQVADVLEDKVAGVSKAVVKID